VGTVAADIFALGMVLYVISTGQHPNSFPVINTTILESPICAEFVKLNAIIVKATHPDPLERFKSAAEMHTALLGARAALEGESNPQPGEP
jgi:hypothetical protein